MRSYLMRSILAWLILSLLVLGCSQPPTTAKVIQVIDGDTVVIEGGYRVRYIGTDTPERGEPYYHEAWRANRNLVGGRVVRLESDITDKDKYGRLLRYVYVNGTFVNQELVRLGYARVYPKGVFPDNKYYELLNEAEAEAKAEGRGIWQQEHPGSFLKQSNPYPQHPSKESGGQTNQQDGPHRYRLDTGGRQPNHRWQTNALNPS